MNINNIITFAVGAIIGSAVTWKLVENKYKKIAQEEIDSVKEVFSRREREEKTENNVEVKDESEEEMSLEQYKEELERMRYTNKSDNEDLKMPEGIHIIEPDEFGEEEDYEVESLTYYKDKIVADDFDNIIEDVDSVIGRESLNHFGEFEDDCVYVRNDNTKTYYEILWDNDNYRNRQEGN